MTKPKGNRRRTAKSPAIAQSQPLPTIARDTSTKSLTQYGKLVNRFYEPLVLLRVLGQVQGDRTFVEPFSGSDQCIRRRFLRNLCYVCDYEKGGDTTTALALAERPDIYTFWVATNVGASPKILPFLEDVLQNLRTTSCFAPDEKGFTPPHIEKKCLEFARSRIKKEISLLKVAAKKCSLMLRRFSSQYGW
jgi:hypothetical protein